LRFQKCWMSAPVLIIMLMLVAAASPVFSRPLAGQPAAGGFLLAGQDHSERNLSGRDLYRPNPSGKSASEQDLSEQDSTEQASPKDTAEPAADSPATDFTVPDSAGFRPVKTKNPAGALLRSLALPGWGQLYNEQYIKSALAAAAEGLLVAGAVIEHGRAEDDHSIYQDLSRSDEVREAAWRRYSRRIDKRNTYLWYYAGFKFLSAIDAYVDAHLYRFDEGPFGVDIEARPEDHLDVLVLMKYTIR